VAKEKKKKYVFVRGSLPSVVWDSKKNKALAEFCDPNTKKVTGIFITTDETVADRLREMGYREKKDFPDGAPTEGFSPRIHPPPDHITPGGPVPKKKVDIDVDETVTDESTNSTKRKTLRRSK